VELARLPQERLPPAVETAAYATVAEAVDDASTRGATFVAVSAHGERDRLVIAAEEDGAARSVPTRIADRVGALGGTVSIDASTLEAQIPCA
jgi:hypothetical protein